MGFGKFASESKWPSYNQKIIKSDKAVLIIQINGKMRDKLEIDAEMGEDDVKSLATGSEKIKKWTEGKEIKKIIFVKNKLINIVI